MEKLVGTRIILVIYSSFPIIYILWAAKIASFLHFVGRSLSLESYIEKRPYEFKIDCLQEVRSLFPPDYCPSMLALATDTVLVY